MQKLHQTILTSDIGTNNPERTTSAGNTKSINTPNVIDIWTPAITDNPLHNSKPAFQLPRNTGLHSTNADSNKNATPIKVNQPPKENITPALTTFEQTMQIIMNIDAISHSNPLHNNKLKSLNCNGLCKYDSLYKAYIFEHSDILVNCSYTPQWYRINTHEIMDSHNIAICNDQTVNIVQLPPVESNEANAIETFARLTTTHRKTKVGQLNNEQPLTSSHN